jgi:glutathione S-transferase
MADITLFAGLMFADAAGIAVPAEHTALSAWRSRVAALPSVKNRSGQDFEPDDLRRLGF